MGHNHGCICHKDPVIASRVSRTLLLCGYQFSNSRELTPSTNDNLICF